MLKKHKALILSLILLVFIALWIAPWQKRSQLTLGLKQEVTELLLPIHGQFPTWLDGVLVRNSSIPIFENGKQVSHPFI